MADISQISCFTQLAILAFIGVMYLYANRENIVYLIKHHHLPSTHQGRVCPGCGSENLAVLKNGSVRCNSCGAIFASTKQLTSKKEKKKI